MLVRPFHRKMRLIPFMCYKQEPHIREFATTKRKKQGEYCRPPPLYVKQEFDLFDRAYLTRFHDKKGAYYVSYFEQRPDVQVRSGFHHYLSFQRRLMQLNSAIPEKYDSDGKQLSWLTRFHESLSKPWSSLSDEEKQPFMDCELMQKKRLEVLMYPRRPPRAVGMFNKLFRKQIMADTPMLTEMRDNANTEKNTRNGRETTSVIFGEIARAFNKRTPEQDEAIRMQLAAENRAWNIKIIGIIEAARARYFASMTFPWIRVSPIAKKRSTKGKN